LVPSQTDIALFAEKYSQHTSQPEALANFRYLPYGPFNTAKEFFAWYDEVIKPSKAVVWFAICVSAAGAEEALRQKRDAGVEAGQIGNTPEVKLPAPAGKSFFAGSIGFLNAVPENAVCEIGHVSFASSKFPSIYAWKDPQALGGTECYILPRRSMLTLSSALVEDKHPSLGPTYLHHHNRHLPPPPLPPRPY
jgi:hypothetical protein